MDRQISLKFHGFSWRAQPRTTGKFHQSLPVVIPCSNILARHQAHVVESPFSHEPGSRIAALRYLRQRQAMLRFSRSTFWRFSKNVHRSWAKFHTLPQANFMKFHAVWRLGKFHYEFHEILRRANQGVEVGS